MENHTPLSSSSSSPWRQSSAALWITFFTALVLTFLAQDAAQGGAVVQRISALYPNAEDRPGNGEEVSVEQVLEHDNDDDDDNDAMEALRRKLEPKKLLLNEKGELSPHQFLHLHHMKTGGTSMDGLVNCGLSRLRAMNLPYNYSNIHECGEARYESCKQGTDGGQCLENIHTAAVMSYCAPLQDLEQPFTWKPRELPAAVTVLRHPVHRVWSMFRFQTKGCYYCRNLTDIYAAIDAGQDQDLRHNCKIQLLNHQTRNLLSNVGDFGENPQSEEAIEQAIANLKNVFTMVGLTEDMDATAAMVSKVFPWLAEQWIAEDAVEWKDGVIPSDSSSGSSSSSATCTMPHANSSPRNNMCGPGGTHWDLPAEPDEATARAIIEHNQADLRLYEAAAHHFELQRQALNLV